MVYFGRRMVLASLLPRRGGGLFAVVTWVALTSGIVSPLAGQESAAVPPAAGAPVAAPAAAATPIPAASPAPVQTPAAPAAAAAAETPAQPAEAAPPEAAAPIEAADDVGTELPPPPASAGQNSRAELERRLRELEDDRTSNFLPWLVVATGATAVVVGAGVGVASAFDCEPNTECSAPPWATLFVVAGTAVGSLGAVWLVRANASIAEFELKKHQIKLDLEQLDRAHDRRAGLARSGSTALNVRVSF